MGVCGKERYNPPRWPSLQREAPSYLATTVSSWLHSLQLPLEECLHTGSVLFEILFSNGSSLFYLVSKIASIILTSWYAWPWKVPSHTKWGLALCHQYGEHANMWLLSLGHKRHAAWTLVFSLAWGKPVALSCGFSSRPVERPTQWGTELAKGRRDLPDKWMRHTLEVDSPATASPSDSYSSSWHLTTTTWMHRPLQKWELFNLAPPEFLARQKPWEKIKNYCFKPLHLGVIYYKLLE